MNNPKSPRIVLLDIESLPDLREVMKHFTGLSNYPGLTLKASINSVICFGWKVYGEKAVHCINAWDFPNWKKDVNDDSLLLKEALKVMESADAIVTHNGTNFDLKFLTTRFLKAGMNPPPKVPHIDTCMVARSKLLMLSNRLDTVARFLTSEKKLENGGWDLWVSVTNRDRAALKLMSDYCKQDIVTLEAVFKRLKPLIENHPNWNLWKKDRVCPKCGENKLQKRGFRRTKVSHYESYQCQACGSWSQKPIKSELVR